MPSPPPAAETPAKKAPTLNDVVDMPTFEQILEMDEPGDCEFSSSIVFGFFDQAEETFDQMDTELEAKKLKELGELGHFLKGSSATLGLNKIRDSCEHIQRYGKHEDAEGNPMDDDAKCLKLIAEAVTAVKKDYADAKEVLTKYYDDKAKEAA